MKSPVTAVSGVGEFTLIDRIRKIIPETDNPDVLLGMGDDCAVVRINDQKVLLLTCDIQVEDRHFRREFISAYQLGRRAIAVNLSDIASMGGQPTYALVSLSLPRDLSVNDYDSLFRGMQDELDPYGAIIVGGNLAQTEGRLIIDITLLGEATLNRYLTRRGARAGDKIFITGQAGSSGAGLFILQKYGKNFPAKYKDLVESHLNPKPRVEIGQAIARLGLASAMIDVSDGIASDLYHICHMSRTGAEISQEKLPFLPILNDVVRETGNTLMDLVLHSGEDYELLFTAGPDQQEQIQRKISEPFSIPVTEIGEIVSDAEVYSVITPDKQRQVLEPRGWDHFRVNRAEKEKKK
jgi:thiamine-monophosphate kinase